MFTVVGIGEVLWDIYREKRFLGGAPANVAIHASQLGDRGIVISRIGNDGMGNELLRTLKEKGLGAEYLQIDKRKGTGTVIIRLDVRGEPSFTCSIDVAFDYLEYTESVAQLAARADAVVFGTLAQRSEVTRGAILQFLRTCKGLRVFDVNARDAGGRFVEIVQSSLELTDILKVNEDEIRLLMKVFRREGSHILQFSKYLMEQFPVKYIAITRAQQGAILVAPDDVLQVAGYRVKVADATGAGDAFTAGLLHQLLAKQTPEGSLRFANQIAAFVCAHRGATPKLSRTAVEKFIHNIEKRS